MLPIAGNRKEFQTLIKLYGELDPSLMKSLQKANSKMTALQKQAGKSSSFWTKLGSGAAKAGKLAAGALAALGATAITTLSAFGVQGLQLASDLKEVQNVVDVTFGEGAEVIDAFAKTSIDAFGLTQLQAKEYTSTLGSMLQTSGVAAEETLVMSQNLAALAGDMASFRNLKPEEAFEKIKSGISGETEPLKALGINMSVANMEAYALSQGIEKSWNSMSQAEQTILRYNYLMESTSQMQGDFASTYDSFANQQKLLTANFQELAATVMQEAEPALAQTFLELNQFMRDLDPQLLAGVATAFIQLGGSVMPLVSQLLPPLLDLFNLLIPPLLELGDMLVPALVEVGQELIEAIGPLIPIFIEIVQALLPPLVAILKPLIQLAGSLAKYLGTRLAAAFKVLGPPIEAVLKLLQPLIDGLSWIFDKASSGLGKIGEYGKWVSSVIFSGHDKDFDSSQLDKYAEGGFASRPSIFGEAGREAAIPIKPGNPRSLALLDQTAKELGVSLTQAQTQGETKTYRITYAPVIHGGDTQEIGRLLERDKGRFREWLEEYLEDRNGGYAF